MSELIIKPRFQNRGGVDQFQYPAQSLNELARNEYQSDYGFYQSNFGLYSFMKFNKYREFVLQTIKGAPLLWQPLTSCVFTPTDTIRTGERTLTPTRVKINEEVCYDEDFGSAFEHMYEYNGGGVELDEDGVRKLNLMTREIMYQAIEGAKNTLASGQLYDTGTVTPSSDNTAEITDAFTLTHGSVKGWVKGLVDLATGGESHLNVPAIIEAGDVSVANHADGITGVFDELKAAAPKKLRRLINRGAVSSANGGQFRALFVVSSPVYNWVATSYNDESDSVATNGRRITREVMPGTGTSGAPQWVFYIDGVPVIPADEISGFDEFIEPETYFAGIIASGNIQLGMSFDALRGNDDGDAGVIVEMSNQVKDWGTTRFLSHALMNASIVDTDFAVATVASITV